jgi:hypothetical protein
MANQINISEAEKSKFPVNARYSENAKAILKLASNKAAVESKGIVGTEDILWAVFAASQTNSRSNAVAQLSERGISFDMIFGKVVLSDNAKTAFSEAIKHAQETNHDVVGSEDLLWALFQKTKSDSKARYWLSSQHVPLPPVAQLRRTLSNVDNGQRAAEPEPAHTITRLFVIGGIAGTFETLVQQPLVYWKTMSQINPQFSITHAVKAGVKPLFRGVGVNAGSIGPISAVQLAAHGFFEGIARKLVPTKVESSWCQLSTASAAGIASCIIVTPVEVIMVNQQTTGKSLMEVCKQVISNGRFSALFRGNVPTAFREAAWTCGFFGITPIVKNALQDDSKFCRRNEVAATALASVISGQVAATASQPTDVIASLMKADAGIFGEKQQYKGVMDACKSLYAQSGFAGFFRGLASRSIRCVGAVFIMGQTQTLLHGYFDKAKFLS